MRRIVRDLRSALSAALLESPEAAEALARLSEEGLSVALVVKEAEEGRPGELGPPPRRRAPGSPGFRIDGRDLAFLRSVGIDPTRRPAAGDGRR